MPIPVSAIPRMQIRYVQHNKIVEAVFNPTIRTEGPGLRKLQRSIRQRGIMAPLHLLHRPADGYDHALADGHRRHAAGVACGIESFPCVIHTEGTPPVLWADLNRDTRKINAYEWMVAWFHSGTEMEGGIPEKFMRSIHACVDILGDRANMSLLVDAGVSPTVASVVQFTHAGFKDLGASFTLPLRHVATWIVEHKLQVSLRTLYRHCWSRKDVKKKLWTRARDNRPFALSEFLSE